MTRVLGIRDAIVCSADLGSVSAATASSFLLWSKMSYLARPGSILAGWRIRNSLTAKGSSMTAKLTGKFLRSPAPRPASRVEKRGMAR
jgi:hypothetical protein